MGGKCSNSRLSIAFTHFIPSLSLSEVEGQRRFLGVTNLSLSLLASTILMSIWLSLCVRVCVCGSVRVYDIQYLQMLIDVMEMMEGLCQSRKHRTCIILRLWLSEWEPVKTADRFMFLY